MDKLTAKQEAFALKYVECNNASEAYRHAYDVGKNTKPETVWEEACKTLARHKVSTRVAELQEALRERTMVTVESITAELEEARQVGRSTEQSSAMTSASMGKAKLHGLLVDKTEATVKHEFDGAAEALASILAAQKEREE